jgi:hypothetical protein
MKFTNIAKAALSVIASLSTYTYVNADATYDAKSVVSDAQLESIVKTLLKIAPSGTKTTNISFDGFFSVNDDRYITALDVQAIKFKVSTKVGPIPLSSNVTMSLAGTIPGLDCSNPQITRVVVTASNPLFEGEIRNHVVKNALSIFRDNIIGQTDLVKYCKIKPQFDSNSLSVDEEPKIEFGDFDFNDGMEE